MESNLCKSLDGNAEDEQYLKYHLVWLDKDIESFSNVRARKKFSKIDSAIKCFSSTEEAIVYANRENISDTNCCIIFIVSGNLSEVVIPKLNDNANVLAVFIFCKNPDAYAHLRFDIVQAICTDAEELVNHIKSFIARNSESTDFSIMSHKMPVKTAHSTFLGKVSEARNVIRNLKEDSMNFLWHSQIHQFMVASDDDDDQAAKAEMIKHSRLLFKNDDNVLCQIAKYERQTLDDDKRNIFFSYTENSFVYSATNLVLRKGNISEIYSYRYIIKLLCRALQIQYEEFVKQHNQDANDSILRLHRGLALKQETIQYIKDNIDNLISFNGFVSATKSEKVAKQFAYNRVQKGMGPVILEIDIDMSDKHTVAFADIAQFSCFQREREVLLSIGSVFRVISVRFDRRNRLYVIHLLLNSNNQLTVSKYIHDTYINPLDVSNRSILFGKMLFDMGEFETALAHFKNGYRHLTDSNNLCRATYLNNIGMCYHQIKKYDDALKYYKKALDMYQEMKHTSGIGICQHNIASVYHARKENELAEPLALKAFDNRQTDLERAATYDLLGCIYFDLSNNDAACNSFEQALELRMKCLGKTNSKHPDIGISYHNLGSMQEKMFKLKEAKRNYEHANEIYRHNYPESHKLVQSVTECLRRIRKT